MAVQFFFLTFLIALIFYQKNKALADLTVKWTAPQPNNTLPLGGYSPLATVFKSNIYYATERLGTYNHNVFPSYLTGEGFAVYWKSSPYVEDDNGQQILFSWSLNAIDWSEPTTLFPNMTTVQQAATMEPGPFLHINGRRYAASSPGKWNTTHDSSAQGSQFCLWPDAVDPRNCGPPNNLAVQYVGTLLMRRLYANGMLGDIFWAAHSVPEEFALASELLGYKTIDEMDSTTQTDIEELGSTMTSPPCNSSDGTLKCEFCPGGCQLYTSINYNLGIANERAHWLLPSGAGDILAYRGASNFLYISTRENSTLQEDWTDVSLSNVPNDNTNLNAGRLPDGRIYLLTNPVVPLAGNGRDPVTLATSTDGLTFDKVGVAVTCTDLLPTSCQQRYLLKTPGPSYPQGLTVTDGSEFDGFYVAYSCNKEDIWITKLDYSAF